MQHPGYRCMSLVFQDAQTHSRDPVADLAGSPADFGGVGRVFVVGVRIMGLRRRWLGGRDRFRGQPAGPCYEQNPHEVRHYIRHGGNTQHELRRSYFPTDRIQEHELCCREADADE